jgi:hypothetical protein
MMFKRFIAAASVAAICSTAPAFAQTSGEVLRENLYNGTLAQGVEALTPAADGGDQEAKFGLGMLRFFQGVERVLNAMYRHGLAAPETGPMGPILLTPLPAHPNPEPIDYEGFRTILADFVDDLDAAKTLLIEAGDSGDYVVTLDPLRFRADIDGNGIAEANESVGAIIGAATGTGPADMSTMPPPPGAPPKVKPQPGKDGTIPEIGIGFDRADAIWLAGYANVIASQGDFLLAHDFSEFLNAIGHRFFPKAGFPMEGAVGTGMIAIDPESDTAIADLIAAIHTISWPVVEPDRLRRVLSRGREVIELSRRNWAAILTETDDNVELIPSPSQTPQLQGPEGAVTQEMVDAWLATLVEVEKILDGELLLPHWRFQNSGFDLRAYLETATKTDMVMIMTGYGALPFIKEGPLASAETFAEADRVFGGNLMGYAFWFN